MAATSSSIEERLIALRGAFYAAIERSRERFTEGKPSLAAKYAEEAEKIAMAMENWSRETGNLCADHRLLEWQQGEASRG